MNTAQRRLLPLSLLGITLLFTASLAWADAGKVLFVTGAVHAEDTQGKSRPLRRGDDIFQGDTLITGSGKIQVRFSDGGLISIQANSRFSIEEYHFSGTADGKEKATLNLVKGGLRAVTGVIGIQAKETYTVKTPVATIGIRGTGFTALYCQGDCPIIDGEQQPDGLHVSTQDGTIYVANSGGTLDVAIGQSAYVASEETPPAPTDTPPLLIDGSGDSGTVVADYTAGDQTDSSGNNTILGEGGSGTTKAIAWANSPNSTAGSGNTGADKSSVTTNTSGHVVAFSNSGATFTSVSGTITDTGNNAIGSTSWGRWTGAYQLVEGATTYSNDPTGMHYIAGTETPIADFNTLAMNDIYGNYDYIGGTTPTDSLGNSGTVNSGSANIYFTDASISGNLSITIAGGTFAPYFSGSFTSNTVVFSASGSETSGCGTGLGTCDITVSGMLVGSNGAGLISSYNIASTIGGASPTPLNITGTVLFEQTGTCVGGC